MMYLLEKYLFFKEKGSFLKGPLLIIITVMLIRYEY